MPFQQSICLVRSVAAPDQLQARGWNCWKLKCVIIPQLNSECKLVYVAVESIKRCLSLCQLRLSKYPKCHELPQGLIPLSCDMCSNRAIEKFFYHLTCEATVLFRSKIYSPSLCLSQASLICLQINSTSTKIPHGCTPTVAPLTAAHPTAAHLTSAPPTFSRPAPEIEQL